MGDVTLGVDMVTITCKCGGAYALTSNYVRDCQREGTCWTCPYCRCGWGYQGRGENARLRKQLEAQRRMKDNARAERDREVKRRQQAERSRAAYKAQATKVKNRVKNGVCPCCNRSFVNLERHMKSQHPNYGGDEK